MEYRVLGKTGLNISRVGLGGIPIQRIDAEGTKVLMHQMKNAGVNYIDTARGYTVSEEYLGYALEGIREHFVIATKSMARTKEAMAKDIDISLGNLKTDFIDLYQVHNPSMAQLEQVIAPGGALEALQEAKMGETVKLLRDVTTATAIVINKSIVLDGNGKKLIATDYSAGMLRQAKKKITTYTNTTLGKASILALPFQDHTFDVVVAANVIHLLDEAEKAISELKRVCKPNGKIILPVYINKEKKNFAFHKCT